MLNVKIRKYNVSVETFYDNNQIIGGLVLWVVTLLSSQSERNINHPLCGQCRQLKDFYL